jgi:hypothetical protein
MKDDNDQFEDYDDDQMIMQLKDNGYIVIDDYQGDYYNILRDFDFWRARGTNPKEVSRLTRLLDTYHGPD